MSETTEMKVPPFDPVAFAGALVLAPVAVTLITAITLVPIAALVLGGPVYLIVGTPTLLWMVGRYPPLFSTYALAGVLGMFALLAIAGLFHLVRPEQGADELAAIFLCGVVFAPLWAGTFAPLYRRFNRMARLVPLS